MIFFVKFLLCHNTLIDDNNNYPVKYAKTIRLRLHHTTHVSSALMLNSLVTVGIPPSPHTTKFYKVRLISRLTIVLEVTKGPYTKMEPVMRFNGNVWK